MNHDFDIGLFILATVISFLSAYTGFRLFLIARQRTGFARQGWVWAAAVAHGGGAIWAMHFISMLALHFHGVVIAYELGFTLLSLSVAICAVGIGLSAISILGASFKVIFSAGSAMGLGVAAMHYLGMNAMTMNATVLYDDLIVGLSIVLAVLASVAALWMVSTLSSERALLAGSFVMAAAVTSMHHVGMAATTFQRVSNPSPELLEQSHVLSAATLAYGVAALTFIVLTLAIAAGLFDRRASASRTAAQIALTDARALQAKWREMLDDVPQMIWSVAADGTREYKNRRWFDFTGDNRDEPKEWFRLVHPDDQAEVMGQWQRCMSTLEPYNGRFRVQHQSGGYRWVCTDGEPQTDENGTVTGWIGTCLDIHARVTAESELEASQALTRGIIEASPDCIGVLDTAGTILFMNDAFKVNKLLNGGASTLGEIWGEDFSPDLRAAVKLALKTAVEGKASNIILSFDSPDGGLRWWDALIVPIYNNTGAVFRLAITARNITRQKAREAEVRWTASHDTLTRLPSRLLFQDTLENAISNGEEFCVLILDVDHFKHINDTLGHETGDALLVELAKRLTFAISDADFVARIGGDEFVIILRNLTSREDTENRAERIVDHLRAPWLQCGRIFDCAASIGASLFPQHGESQPVLMKSADIALYNAKANSRGRVTFYEPPMRLAMESRAQMLSLARKALADNLIVPCYQAIHNLQTGTLVGFEALLRWQHRSQGLQLPGTIEAAFEDPELAVDISDRMIASVFKDIKGWLENGMEFGYIAINASAAEFKRGDFAEKLLSKLATAKIPANNIQIEVTETVFLGRGAEYVERALQILNAHGVKIALDDFGTGYASLSHLRQFPVDVIKIDRSFVQGLPSDSESAAIVDAVIGLGRSLNIAVVAEGIETVAQKAKLVELGCPLGQGFLFAKALPASKLKEFLRTAVQRERIAA